MNEIYIAGHVAGTLQPLLQSKPKELDALVMTNVNWTFPKNVSHLCKSVLHLTFNDTSLEFGLFDGKPIDSCPKKFHIEEILKWSQGKEKIVSACHQGVARSSAAAYLIACNEWGIERALGILTPHKHWPNSLMVRLGSEVLGDKGVWKEYMEWYNRACSVDINDDFTDDLQSDKEEIEL